MLYLVDGEDVEREVDDNVELLRLLECRVGGSKARVRNFKGHLLALYDSPEELVLILVVDGSERCAAVALGVGEGTGSPREG